jgi:hypothetical protein
VPSEPPAWNVVPSTSVLPTIRLRNAQAEAKKSVTPKALVYAASGDWHQK